VRAALATLPWVEQTSIQTDIPTREVRFNLKDKSAWKEEEVRGALRAKSFPEMTVKSSPP
jgi:hypothetical protein